MPTPYSLDAAIAGELTGDGLINVNFTAGRHGIPERPGAVWNNLAGGSGVSLPLLDGAGRPTAATISFSSAGEYAEFGEPKTLNRLYNRLYRGGLVGNDLHGEVDIRIDGIPFAVFDVYVFASQDTANTTLLHVVSGDEVFYFRGDGATNGNARALLPTSGTGPDVPTIGPAQYQVFRNRRGGSFRVHTGGSRHCVLSNNIFGLQVVRADGPAATTESETAMASRTWRGPAKTAAPPRSELMLPVAPGTTIRVRYRGPGGGAVNVYSGGDIALHVNPRPHEGLVLNSHLNGSWGGEERPDDYPFPDGDEVSLSVWASPEGFYIQAVARDGSPPFCYLYGYRLDEDRRMDRITIDIPGLVAVSVQPEM